MAQCDCTIASGTTVEGRELSVAEVEQMFRETLLSDVLELAAAKLRAGEGWDEGTTTDVLNEILHAHPAHAKKALALALLGVTSTSDSGKNASPPVSLARRLSTPGLRSLSWSSKMPMV